jgi:hypothetical protein
MANLIVDLRHIRRISAPCHHDADVRATPKVKRPMLFIFSKPNFVQIAWNSIVPDNQSRVRNTVMTAPIGPLGFIRTRSVG